jgi:hypothetical protein
MILLQEKELNKIRKFRKQFIIELSLCWYHQFQKKFPSPKETDNLVEIVFEETSWLQEKLSEITLTIKKFR